MTNANGDQQTSQSSSGTAQSYPARDELPKEEGWYWIRHIFPDIDEWVVVQVTSTKMPDYTEYNVHTTLEEGHPLNAPVERARDMIEEVREARKPSAG